jgi:uncharacterized protein with NRDE domain
VDTREREALVHDMAELPRNGFNFLAWNLRRGDGWWFSNRPQPQQRQLGAGLHGLSNAMLDTPWPKVQRLQERVAAALVDEPSTSAVFGAAFAALADPVPARDDELPCTGVPLERERQLSSAFIRIDSGGAVYGTRCSTVVVVEQQAARRLVHVVERTLGPGPGGEVVGESAQQFELAGA